MTPTWTPAAVQAFDRFLAEFRQRQLPDIDAEEVAADMRHHVEAEVASAGISVVTEADVRRMLARFGELQEPTPPSLPKSAAPPPSEPSQENKSAPDPVPADVWKRPKFGRRFFWMSAGVILPVIACAIEWFGEWCSSLFFDPLPSATFLLLALLVPLSNFLLARKILAQTPLQIPRWLWFVHAVASGVALYFTLMFVPLLPPAIPAVLLLGLGLLPMAPLCGWFVGWRLKRVARTLPASLDSSPPGSLRLLSALTVVVLISLSVPHWATLHWASAANLEEPVPDGHVRLLRRWGSRDTLLRACYGSQNTFVTGLLGMKIDQPKAQRLYFLATGEAFNQVEPPRFARSAFGARMRRAENAADAGGDEFDEAIGGENVATIARGLALSASRMDAVVGSTEGTAYLEWTLEFRNDHEWLEREARAQVQLPPGGAVSRLTLWVNGEEREAAFGGRSNVREAYQTVAVAQRRDPVLVTTAGPDRVLVQCFPVPRKGGLMKVRLGITAPMHLQESGEAEVPWPRIVERNFRMPQSLQHALWVEAGQELRTAHPKLQRDVSKPERPVLRGALTETELNDPVARIRVTRAPDASALVWAEDPHVSGASFIRQRLEQHPTQARQRVAVVLDDSSSLALERSALVRTLQEAPTTSELAVFVASDEVRMTQDRAAIGGLLETSGGHDNLPALMRAWDWAAEKESSVILWIHGPQPIVLSGVEPLIQRYQRGNASRVPVIHDLAVRSGPNRLIEKLDGLEAARLLIRTGSLEEDVKRMLTEWSGRGTERVWVRERVAGKPGEAEFLGKKGSAHVVRLHVLKEVRQKIRTHALPEATRLAAMYQLVTPVSGAVVLETVQQYQQTGLTPVDPSTVPLVPEPETVALLVVGVAALWIRRHFTQRNAGERR